MIDSITNHVKHVQLMKYSVHLWRWFTATRSLNSNILLTNPNAVMWPVNVVLVMGVK
jgi:hypothetical protein